MRFRDTVKIIAVVTAIVAWAGPVVAQEGPVPTDYKLQPDDVLVVGVVGEEALSHEYRMGPSGTVSFDLVGPIEVLGLTIPELQAKLTHEYDKYIINPKVSVNIRDTGIRRVSVSGEVKIPGPLTMKVGSDVLDCIGAAGGPIEARADLSVVRLVHVGVVRILNLAKGSPTLDADGGTIVYDGDSISIPSRFVGTALVTGFVTKPSEVEIEPHETLVDAIGRAGGLADGANPSNVTVTRKDGTVEVYDYRKAAANAGYDENPLIYPGDRINVRENVNYFVSVVGGVIQSKVIPFADGLTFTDAIGRCGGPGPSAYPKRIRILRKADPKTGQTESIPVDYTRVIKGEIPDPLLQPGDTIDVPARPSIEKYQEWSQYIQAVVGAYLLYRNYRSGF